MSQATMDSPSRMHSAPPRHHSAGRVAVTFVLILSLAATALTRYIAQDRWDTITGARGRPAGSAQALSQMNSFALALLLGGLRGPLVMILWTSSETQKQDKQLEDFDTKVEWIRMLQPEFDSVHLFQIWNKAYNVSVQMASLANKYITIIDALDYADSVLRERPDDINIISAIGGIYFDKLGGSLEKVFYRGKVREQTQWHNVTQQNRHRGETGWRRLSLDPILDANGNVLPELLKPTHTAPAGLHPGDDFYDGSEMQELKQFEPFTYGVSPLALGFNYYKRSQLLQRTTGQRHVQLSTLVVDSRPALALKMWAAEELERARRAEILAFGREVPPDRNMMEMPTARISMDEVVSDKNSLGEAQFEYGMTVHVLETAVAEYQRHLQLFHNNAVVYQSHLDEVMAQLPLAKADADFLNATTKTGAERDALLQSAATEYRAALTAYEVIVLHYYIDDTITQALYKDADGKPLSRAQIGQLPPAALDDLLPRALTATAMQFRQSGYDQFKDDRDEFLGYISRIVQRGQMLPAK